MKIYSAGNRRQQVVDRYDRLRNEQSEAKARQRSVYDEYSQEGRKVAENIKAQIWNELGNVSIPSFDVRCESNAHIGKGGKITYEVIVGNDRGYTGDLPFAWSYRVQVDDDGNVQKSSNSWSGLDATTPENIDILQETVDVLRKLSAMDWENILQSSIYWDDYQSRLDGIETIPNSAFDNEEAEIMEASLDDIIGESEVVVGPDYHDGAFSNTGYYQLLGETDTSYRIKFVPSSTFDGDFVNALDNVKPSRVKKATFIRLLSRFYKGRELDTVQF